MCVQFYPSFTGQSRIVESKLTILAPVPDVGDLVHVVQRLQAPGHSVFGDLTEPAVDQLFVRLL